MSNAATMKVRNGAKIRNRYNQVLHMTQDTTMSWKSDKNTIEHNKQEPREQSFPFPAGDHKAAMNRRESMTNTRHK